MTVGGQPSAGGYHAGQYKRVSRKKSVDNTNVTKQRVEITPQGTSAVIESKSGPVTFLDKIKSYYHTLIIVTTALLALATQIAPLGDFLPGPGKNIVTGVILFVGSLLTFLKSNEIWVDKL